MSAQAKRLYCVAMNSLLATLAMAVMIFIGISNVTVTVVHF